MWNNYPYLFFYIDSGLKKEYNNNNEEGGEQRFRSLPPRPLLHHKLV